MQTMNTDQQTFYANPAASHQQAPAYYMQTNGMEQQFQVSMRPPYAPRMQQQYINQPIPNGYQQQFIFSPNYPQHPYLTGNNPRPMNAPFIIRPTNENPNGTPNFHPQAAAYPAYGHGNNNLPTTPPVYPPPPFYASTFQMPTTGYPPPQPQIPNQPPIPQQTQYSMTPGLPQQIPIHSQPTQHPQIIEQPHVPASQPTLPPTMQQSVPQINPYTQPASSSVQPEKRQRKPLAIVDPVSQKL
jgi:hypothetical protein